MLEVLASPFTFGTASAKGVPWRPGCHRPRAAERRHPDSDDRRLHGRNADRRRSGGGERLLLAVSAVCSSSPSPTAISRSCNASCIWSPRDHGHIQPDGRLPLRFPPRPAAAPGRRRKNRMSDQAIDAGLTAPVARAAKKKRVAIPLGVSSRYSGSTLMVLNAADVAGGSHPITFTAPDLATASRAPGNPSIGWEPTNLARRSLAALRLDPGVAADRLRRHRSSLPSWARRSAFSPPFSEGWSSRRCHAG